MQRSEEVISVGKADRISQPAVATRLPGEFGNPFNCRHPRPFEAITRS
jgi:hypothetical protein